MTELQRFAIGLLVVAAFVVAWAMAQGIGEALGTALAQLLP